MGARLQASKKCLRPVAVLQEGDKLRRHCSGAIRHALELADIKIAISLILHIPRDLPDYLSRDEAMEANSPWSWVKSD
jgi:hypothetical protein